MRSRKLLYAYGIAAIAMVALVTSAVFVGLSGGNPTPLESSGAQVDGRVHLVESDFAPSLPESEAKAQAIDFLRGPWDIDEPTKLPIQVATGAFTGLREDTNTQTSNLGVWVVVFHDFPAHARVARGATSIPTDPRVTVIVDDNSGNVIYSALSWDHGIMTPIPTRTAVPTPTPLPSGITGATPIPTGGGQLHPPQLTDDDHQLTTVSTNESVGLWIPSPTTVQDLVDISEAIVVGEIVGLQKQTIEGPFGYSEDTDSRDDVPPVRQYPYSYFGIRISDTMLDDGFVSDNPVLKLKGHGGDGANSQRRIRLPQAGESFVLFLTRHRYDGSYGVLGPWAMLNTDGSTVTGYGAGLKEPQFAQGTTPAQLKIDVAEAVGSRVKKNPTDLLFPNIIILSTPDTPAPR